MSSSSSSAPNARLLDEAAEWVVRVHAEEAGEADWLALEAWLAADPEHTRAYDHAETLWAQLDDQTGEIGPRIATEEASIVIDLASRRARVPQRRWMLPAAAAAAVLVAVGLFGALSWPKVEVYDTAPGEIRVIALEDGSRIRLNGASHIEVRMSRRTRAVEMAQAEAAFDVAHDTARPFVVSVGDDRVRVVGTEFNIRRQPDLTTVTVRRGVVEVTPAAGRANTVRLPAGTSYERADKTVKPTVRAVAPDAAFAWSTGRLIYDNQPLSRVAADLGRKYRTPITVDGTAANLRFTGVLVLDGEDRVISRLEAFLPVTAHRGAAGITLTSKAKSG